jgi:hypothetical protein
MGTYNDYRELKQIAGVEKRLKYKQDVSIKAAKEKGRIDEEHFKVVAGGACCAFTMLWLSDKVLPARKNSPWYIKQAGPVRSDTRAMEIAATFAIPAFIRYDWLFENKNQHIALRDLAKSCGLKFRNLESAGYDLAPEHQGFLKGFAYLVTTETKQQADHSVGMIRDESGDRTKCLFFDPNVGEYAIGKDNWDQFFEVYDKILREKFKWSMGPLRPYELEKR